MICLFNVFPKEVSHLKELCHDTLDTLFGGVLSIAIWFSIGFAIGIGIGVGLT